MNKNTKLIVSISVIILLLVVGFYYFAKSTTPKNNIQEGMPTANFPIEEKEHTAHFTDADNTFSFDYNALFSATEGDKSLPLAWRLNASYSGLLLAQVFTPEGYMPSTNFSDADLTVGRSSNSNEIKNCLSKRFQDEKNLGLVTISGFPFQKFTYADGAAGNFYDTTSYRGIVDGDCYAIEYTIHSTNISNYSPDQGIKEFDKAKIVAELENILKSFTFLIRSS